MGLDGSNYLTICGPHRTLDTMEQTRLITAEEVNNDTDIVFLMENYFSEDNCKINRVPKQLNGCGQISSNVLRISFNFRNIEPTDFFIALLRKYPDCHIKNEYNTEMGDSGIWIGSVNGDGSLNIQSAGWVDITMDEMVFDDYGLGM
uniref:YubB ferredoxin-like domain-containing protein n=1 Tax=viral metagenome TaxID=1070528 RepID=A0A6C0EJE3_9ZZZZ